MENVWGDKMFSEAAMQGCSVKIAVLNILGKFTRKHPCWGPISK